MNKKFWLYVFASIVFMAALPLYTVKIITFLSIIAAFMVFIFIGVTKID